MLQRLILILSLLFMSGWLAACNTDGGAGTISTTAPMEAKFDPSASVVPFPFNVLFQDSTTGFVDGTLQIPVVNPADYSDPKVAMNELDGFSTIAPITTTFSLSIDPATVPAGVRVFEVVDAGIGTLHTAGGFIGELAFGTDFVALPSPSNARTLVIKPVRPLKSNANYMVVVTSALKAVSGQAAVPSAVFRLLKSATPLVDAFGVSQVPGVDDATAQQLEGLRQRTAAQLAVANGVGITTDTIAIAWTLKTQTINQVLANIQANIASDPYANSAANFMTVAAPPSAGTGGLGVMDIYSFVVANDPYGTLGLQDAYANGSFANIGSVAIGAANQSYYLEDNSVNPMGPLTGFFQIDAYGMPVIKSMQTEPFLVILPNAPAAGGQWPVVIFQHGITRDKSDVFGIANTLAKAGFATIAMDMVLHGDRTFGVDYINNTTGAAGPDGIPDPSGQHFINLTSLLTSRDNLRQSVADLVHLTSLLKLQTMNVVNNTNGQPGADATPDLDAVTPISFVGHSLGAMVGGVLAGVEPSLPTFVMSNPGGEIATLLQNSATFGPIIDAGLAANGVTVGSPDYDAFFIAAQTVIDDGDPSNYAAPATLAGKNLLLFKTLDDLVIPNSNTDALSMAFGFQQVMATPAPGWPLGFQPSPFAGNGFTFFTAGSHSSFLLPDPPLPSLVGLDVITEMQSETANYLGSALLGGATVVIGATPLPSGGGAAGIMQ